MPPQKQTRHIELDDGRDVAVRPIKRIDRDTARIQVTDEARWRLDVANSEIVGVVTSWDENGELADVPVPEWMDLVLGRMP